MKVVWQNVLASRYGTQICHTLHPPGWWLGGWVWQQGVFYSQSVLPSSSYSCILWVLHTPFKVAISSNLGSPLSRSARMTVKIFWRRVERIEWNKRYSVNKLAIFFLAFALEVIFLAFLSRTDLVLCAFSVYYSFFYDWIFNSASYVVGRLALARLDVDHP